MLQQHIKQHKLSATHSQAHKVLHCVNSKSNKWSAGVILVLVGL